MEDKRYFKDAEKEMEVMFGKPASKWEYYKYQIKNAYDYVCEIPYKIKVFYLRGKYGYTYYDAFSGHTYLAKVIAGILRQIQKNSFGWPAGMGMNGESVPYYDDIPTPEAWIEKLNYLASIFEEWVKFDNSEDDLHNDYFDNKIDCETFYKLEEEKRKHLISEMSTVFKYWGSLWD
jgi:hypothetical protein